jgi:hypothetical protein
MRMSAVGQPLFTYTSSFQWCCNDSCSSAGNHCAACESPNRASTVDDEVSPYTQLPGSVDPSLITQLSR